MEAVSGSQSPKTCMLLTLWISQTTLFKNLTWPKTILSLNKLEMGSMTTWISLTLTLTMLTLKDRHSTKSQADTTWQTSMLQHVESQSIQSSTRRLQLECREMLPNETWGLPTIIATFNQESTSVLQICPQTQIWMSSNLLTKRWDL